ncbi:MAG TPA: hypothetical protein VFA43_05685 [Gemmatimonadaceae bacterium]|nr:hypothetical protein [Gemmatimonadaceae bacterium]
MPPTVQATRTSMEPESVLTHATRFFSRQNSLYTAFPEKRGPNYATFRGQGGEEIIIGVANSPDGGTAVTGSSYMFDAQIARFFSTLPPA